MIKHIKKEPRSQGKLFLAYIFSISVEQFCVFNSRRKESMEFQQNEAYMVIGAFREVPNVAYGVMTKQEALPQPAYEEVMDIVSTRGKEKPPEYEEIIL